MKSAAVAGSLALLLAAASSVGWSQEARRASVGRGGPVSVMEFGYVGGGLEGEGRQVAWDGRAPDGVVPLERDLFTTKDFYLDRAHLPPWQRGRINFDHPRAIDWRRFEAVLRESRVQREVSIPQYNFATHTRLPHDRPWTPAPLILVDGLWLLGRARVRRLFDFRIYLDCPGQLRLERRLSRDVTERGRTADSVRDQFWKMVAPMHERYVATQLRLADLVLQQPSGEVEIHELVAALHAMVPALRQVEEDTPPLSRPADGHKGRSCSKPARTGGLAAGPPEPRCTSSYSPASTPT